MPQENQQLAQNQELLAWLSDARSIELEAAEMLESLSLDAWELPHYQARLQLHLDQTRLHEQKLRGCIEALGGSPSGREPGSRCLFGRARSVATGLADDELVRDILCEFATENLEIACYRSIIAAAHELGQEEVESVCRGILQDEEEMARWVEEQIPVVTRSYLRRKAAETD